MKKILASVFAFMAISMTAKATDDRVLLTIDGKPSTVEEFMYIYQKNTPSTADSTKQSVEDYLDLFINFKLKVHEAEQLGLDTTAAFKKEFANYRNQATPKYMTDAASEEALVQKVYGRMLWDKKVRHLAIACPANATPEEEAAALALIERAHLRVTTGEPKTIGKGRRAKTVPGPVEDFEEVTMEMSEDPNLAHDKGLIGWITPFRYIMPVENAAYDTPVGGVSDIFRSHFGFHILKVEEEAPHREIHAAHIMKMTPQGDIDAAVKAQFQIDSIYQALQQGANFAATAIAESDDRGSASQGGDLGWFGRGQMVAPFENVAFDMAMDSSISEPVLSQFGWHIIQFLGARGTADLADIHDDVMKKIRQSEHRSAIEEGFINRLKNDYHFTENKTLLAPFYAAIAQHGVTDSAFIAQTADLHGELFAFADKHYTQADFAQYLQTNFFSRSNSGKALIDEKYNAFVARELRAEEDSNLEAKYPELRHLMNEYHDGILLFDISLQHVWDKASQDTVGITRFFEEHKDEYKWADKRFKGYVVHCKDKNTQKAAKRILRSAEPDSIASYLNNRLNVDSVTYVRFTKGLWEKGKNPAVDKYGLRVRGAEFTPSEELPYVFTYGKKLKRPEVYTDERGKVTAAYQDYLEKEWVKALREKYEVVVNEEVLESIK